MESITAYSSELSQIVHIFCMRITTLHENTPYINVLPMAISRVKKRNDLVRCILSKLLIEVPKTTKRINLIYKSQVIDVAIF